MNLNFVENLVVLRVYPSAVESEASSFDISIFSSGISHIRRYSYRLYFDALFLILLTFFESLRVVLKNMVPLLMISAKLSTLVFLEIKVMTS